ncbi:MAG: hypothetical protein GY754_12005 [bacterium]|nr:hypothetical protein [bacterium]
MSAKTSMKKIIGYILFFSGLFFFVPGLGMFLTSTDPEELKTAKEMLLYPPILMIIPGIILIILGRRLNKKEKQIDSNEEEQIDSLVAVVKAYRRIALSDLADKLKIQVPVAQDLLIEALRLKKIEGHFDRSNDEFFTDEGEAKKSDVSFCPSCGTPIDGVFLQGETVTCKTCGKIIQQM